MLKVYIGRHIMLVDDDVVFQAAAKVLLEKAGFRLTIASSGEQCLQLLQDMAPSLLLLDISMEGLTGLDVLRQIRSMPSQRTLPTMMITGKGETAAIGEAAKLGVCDFVLKPFDPKELVARVTKHSWFLRAEEIRGLLQKAVSSDDALARRHGRDDQNAIVKDCYGLHVHDQSIVLMLPIFTDPKEVMKCSDVQLAELVQVIAKGNPSWRIVFPTASAKQAG